MRIHVALFCFLASAGAVQSQSPNSPVRVRTLTIISDDLPASERTRVVRAIQGHSFPLSEISEHVLQCLREDGYAKARGEIPQLATILSASPTKSLDLTVQVSAGTIYRLGPISFTGNKQITNIGALRAQFPLNDGDRFSATAIGRGLSSLKKAYQSLGYINFGAVPTLQYNESQHTVSLTIDIHEGLQYLFGHLLLDGVEPHPGMAQALHTAWKPLEDGDVYSPRLLSLWLRKNAMFIPHAETAPEKYVSLLIDDDDHRVDVQLKFP